VTDGWLKRWESLTAREARYLAACVARAYTRRASRALARGALTWAKSNGSSSEIWPRRAPGSGVSVPI
jgi:hypothetical protein